MAYEVPPSVGGPSTARCLIVVTPDAQRTMNTYLGAASTLVPADIDERFAQEVVQRTKGQDPTAKLQKSLDALGQSVRDESRHFKRDELRLLSITRLESLERHWKFYGTQLEEWRRDLKQASGPYTEDAAELSRRRASWDATRDAAQSTELAPALSNRVERLLAQITLAEQAVSGPIEKQIPWQA